MLLTAAAAPAPAAVPAEEGGGAALAPQPRGVDPEQLALLEEAFDAQDEDGDGAWGRE